MKVCWLLYHVQLEIDGNTNCQTFKHVELGLDTFGHVWTCLDTLGHVWTRFFWTRLDTFAHAPDFGHELHIFGETLHFD